jgi:hypothetical protein
MTEIQLHDGSLAVNIHPQRWCKGRPCAVHNPSDHALKDAPMNWDSNNGDGLFLRICHHDVAHPDYDSLAHLIGQTDTFSEVFTYRHICCVEKCCGIPEQIRV